MFLWPLNLRGILWWMFAINSGRSRPVKSQRSFKSGFVSGVGCLDWLEMLVSPASRIYAFSSWIVDVGASRYLSYLDQRRRQLSHPTPFSPSSMRLHLLEMKAVISPWCVIITKYDELFFKSRLLYPSLQMRQSWRRTISPPCSIFATRTWLQSTSIVQWHNLFSVFVEQSRELEYRFWTSTATSSGAWSK